MQEWNQGQGVSLKVIDICDSRAHLIFPVARNLLEQHNSNLGEVKQKKICELVYQFKDTQFKGNQLELAKEVYWF